LNTSFNPAGEPLVETSTDAIKSYALGAFKAIYYRMANIKVLMFFKKK
jgi:predicted NodU family carbamoyl transferase